MDATGRERIDPDEIGINSTEVNDQGAFDAGNNPLSLVAGTYLFGASPLCKINSSASARMRGRLVLTV